MATAAATGGPNHAAREARRRRIIERGSDRLALISGRIQSLPPDPDQSRDSASIPAQITPADSSEHEDSASNSLLPNEESVKDVKEHEQHAVSHETVEHPPDNNQEGGNIPSRSVVLHDSKEESSQIRSSVQRPGHGHQYEQTHRSLFTAGQIKTAVAASENSRMSCSVAAAVLVIATYMGLPILSFFRGIMILKPVYLLLLTNITIVLGRVFLGARGIESRSGRSRAPIDGGNDLANQLGRAMELGMLMQKIIGAVFMDFSIYAVVLVSGFSLVHKLGREDYGLF